MPHYGDGYTQGYWNDTIQTEEGLCFTETSLTGPHTRGKHNNCDTIYIAQNYFRLPRHTVQTLLTCSHKM